MCAIQTVCAKCLRINYKENQRYSTEKKINIFRKMFNVEILLKAIQIKLKIEDGFNAASQQLSIQMRWFSFIFAITCWQCSMSPWATG